MIGYIPFDSNRVPVEDLGNNRHPHPVCRKRRLGGAWRVVRFFYKLSSNKLDWVSIQPTTLPVPESAVPDNGKV